LAKRLRQSTCIGERMSPRVRTNRISKVIVEMRINCSWNVPGRKLQTTFFRSQQIEAAVDDPEFGLGDCGQQIFWRYQGFVSMH
jgi:hypothetical protein